jgi:hydrogenase expression/formation protein HypE
MKEPVEPGMFTAWGRSVFMLKFDPPQSPLDKREDSHLHKRGYEHIRLSHGSGGKLTLELIEDLFVKTFASGPVRDLTDAAILENPGGRIAFATDSHSVKPIFFPGGDIGRLSVAGTVNDLAVMGAKPFYMSCGFILEEGFAMKDLACVVRSMKRTADEAGVQIVTGDTKVVERGKGDGIFINTTGIGFIPNGREIGPQRVESGDVLLVNGTLGDHGIAVMSQREGFTMTLELKSDVAPLNDLTETILRAAPNVHFMRDITRGGLAAVANELVMHKPFGVRIFEANVPLHHDVVEYSEMLGIDPLLSANEGKILIAVAKHEAEAALQAMKSHPLGRDAAIIGDVIKQPQGKAIIETMYGSRRLLEMPLEEQLPRIC